MRSKLFVPGARPELFDKALAGAADALSFDLEDAVAPERKAAARVAVAAFLASSAVAASSKLMIVRVNAPASEHFAADLAAVAREGADLINLPKIESADALHEAVAALERAEARNGVVRPIGLLVNIETPRAAGRGLDRRRAPARGRAAARPGRSVRGPGHRPRRPRQRPRRAVRGAHGRGRGRVFALDGAYADLHDEAGYFDEALVAKRLGFLGKTCLHPRQVGLANRAFAASADEIARARRIVSAAETAADGGRGVFVVDGRMIDRPFLKRAQALLATAERP
nr:CoA ester lyase [Lysobacter enzymogenes]